MGTPELEIFFGTFNTSDKYQNLKANPKVAFTIGGEADYITVQYRGMAEELAMDKLEPFLSQLHEKIPSSANFHKNPAQRYFLVKPTWIRYSDLSGEEEKIEELTF